MNGSNHTRHTKFRTLSERAWMTLTDEERDKAVSVAYQAGRSYFHSYGDDMKYVKTPYKFLEDKLFNDFEKQKPLEPRRNENGTYTFVDPDDRFKRYNENLVYHDKETNSWYKK